MVEHVNIPDAQRHEPKGIAGAAPGLVYVSDGAASGAWGLSPSGLSNVVIVDELAKFPTPVSDVITLAASTTYLIVGNIPLGINRIAPSLNSQLLGTNRFTDGLTYTGTGALFTTATSFLLTNLSFSAASGTIFNLTGVGTEGLIITDCFVTSCLSVGTITSWRSTTFNSFSVLSATVGGLLFVGACSGLFYTGAGLNVNVVGTALDLGSATFDRISVGPGNRWDVGAGNIGVSGLINSGNLNVGGRGEFLGCIFEGAGTHIQNITSTDTSWTLTSAGITNTSKNAQGYNHTPSTTTIGVGAGDNTNPIVMDAQSNFVTGHADQFTVDTEGRITYIGIDPGEFHVRAIVNGTIAAGTQTVNHYIAINGIEDIASLMSREYASGSNGTVTAAAIETLENGDYIEVFVENTGSIADWTTNVVNLIVIEV
jgi:hypothetical protein